MSAFFALPIILFFLVCAVFRMLHLSIYAGEPSVFYKQGSQLVNSVLELCPIFKEVYVPPLLWGKSGHLQTIIYARLGRVNSPYPKGERHNVVMSDGATMIYDVFEPHRPHTSKGDYTFVLCPGIANDSEASYIRTFVNYAQEYGFRVSVLNHIGAVRSVKKLTAPRIFTYGGTEEYGTMVDEILRRYPETLLIGVGFSMGANVVLKYIGEDNSRQKNFLCAMSLCQGYDAHMAVEAGLDWHHLRRLYCFIMTCNQKRLLRQYYDVLLCPDVIEKYNINLDGTLNSTSLMELDEFYSRRRAGYNKLEDYYKEHSCVNYLHNISLPLYLLNAEDDPLVPPPLVNLGKQYAETHDNCLLVETRHGGHLGYFEKGIITPDSITWIDRSAVQFAEAIITLHVARKLSHLKLKSS